MEYVKDSLKEMEKDALITTNSEFVTKYGKEKEKIWRQLNCPGFNNYFDFYNTEEKMGFEDKI